jgi:hypothetical protein
MQRCFINKSQQYAYVFESSRKQILIAEIALRIPKVTASLSKNPSKVDPNFIDDLL